MAEKLKPPYDTPECNRTGEIIEKMRSQGWDANVSVSNRQGWRAFVFEYRLFGIPSGCASGTGPLDALRKAIWLYIVQEKHIQDWEPPPGNVLEAFERFGAAQPSDYIGRYEVQLSGTHV